MGSCNLDLDSNPQKQGVAVNKRVAPILKSIGSILEELFPFYLNMGMTYHQYWEEDPEIAIFYRKAYIERKKEELDKINLSAYYIGLYNYHAIACCSPILRAFSKANKPIEYMSEPFPNTKEEADARKESKRQDNLERLKMELERSAKKK